MILCVADALSQELIGWIKIQVHWVLSVMSLYYAKRSHEAKTSVLFLRMNLSSRGFLPTRVCWNQIGLHICSAMLACQNSFRPSDPYCVSKLAILASDNGLSPGQRQAIIWTSTGILFIRTSEIVSEIHIFSFNKCILKCRLWNGGNFVWASMC